MGSYNEGPVLSYTADVDIARYLRVKHGTAGDAIDIAGDEEFIGMTRASVMAGNPVGVTDINRGGTFVMVANGAISEGGDVFTAAAGKVSGSGTNKIGKAETATTSDGDYVTVKPELLL